MLLSCTVTDERFGLETASVALAARHLDHELLQLHAYRVGFGLVVPTLDVARAHLPTRPRRSSSVALAALVAVEHRVAHRLREVAPRRVEVELELTRQRRQHDLPQISARLAPRENHALENRDARIAEDELLRSRGAACRGRRTSEHAPNGELNEKWRGSSSGSEMPQVGQP